MTPNWPELWAREPGLRPDFAGYRLVENAPWYMLAEKCSSPTNVILPGEVSDSLCRDAAARWLAERAKPGDLRICAPGVYNTDKFAVEMLNSDTPTGNGCVWFGDTLDDALFAACTAVLDARLEPVKKN